MFLFSEEFLSQLEMQMLTEQHALSLLRRCSCFSAREADGMFLFFDSRVQRQSTTIKFFFFMRLIE